MSLPRMKRESSAVLAAFASCLFSCSPSKMETIPSAQNVTASPFLAAPRPGEWADWPHEKKLAHMKSTVFPVARALFTEYDPVKYADFNCASCHGAGAVDNTYKMPNPDLPKWPGGPDAFRKLAEKDPKMLRFMSKVLQHEMARLLSVKPFDMASHTGFSCFHCHPRGEERAELR